MEATMLDQQREARRQKVLARSQGGHRAPVVDLAAEQGAIAPQGLTAVLDEQGSGSDVLGHAASSPEESGKSASRLAAERRRQRILSKSTQRMAKVQGDRAIRTGDQEGAREEEGGGGETLDDMLEAAEAEFFGDRQQHEGQELRQGGSVAEAKPAAPRQAYFKSAKGGGGGGSPWGDGGATATSDATGAAAQKKPSRQASGAGGAFKPAARSDGDDGVSRQSPSPPSGGGGVAAGRASSRRPTGNKALEKQAFDLAAIQSLSRAAWTEKGTDAPDPGRKRLLGGVRFWTGLEGATKTVLLLLVGAGVGGLLLPEARAAVAQAKFEAEHVQIFADSRSRLELFLARGGLRENAGGRTNFDVDFAASSASDEFGGIADVASSDSSLSRETVPDLKADGATALREGGGGGVALPSQACVEDAADDVDGGMVSQATNWFLGSMDFLVAWAHYLSSVSMPWGGGVGEISCVSAIYLAMLVRILVAAVFAAVRVVLGLPAFPPYPSSASSSTKPGMGMVFNMILAAVPTLGKLLAWGNILKSIFADTNLVVAGTVLTLALCLALEDGAGPSRLAGSISGALGLFPSFHPSEAGGGGLKEL